MLTENLRRFPFHAQDVVPLRAAASDHALAPPIRGRTGVSFRAPSPFPHPPPHSRKSSPPRAASRSLILYLPTHASTHMHPENPPARKLARHTHTTHRTNASGITWVLVPKHPAVWESHAQKFRFINIPLRRAVKSSEFHAAILATQIPLISRSNTHTYHLHHFIFHRQKEQLLSLSSVTYLSRYWVPPPRF